MNDPEIQNATASVWMKRGIALLNENTGGSLAEAVRWFDRAIKLRRALPLQNPWYRYVLAAGWMNRADALTRLGSKENLAEAVRSYDEALTCLRALNLETNPLFRQRLAVAWTNRGITLQVQATRACFAAALECFETAVGLLRNSPTAETRPILAGALMNRGSALLNLTPDKAAAARASAEEALALVANVEETELLAAETGLKARHLLCRAIATQLAGDDAPNTRADLVTAATDAVEDGMRVARQWERKGDLRFRELAEDLFRFGAHVYELHQSHFLTEFLLENLDSARSSDALPVHPRLHAIAEEAVTQAFQRVQRDGFQAVNTPRFHRYLETVRQLRQVEERLGELRRNLPLVAR